MKVIKHRKQQNVIEQEEPVEPVVIANNDMVGIIDPVVIEPTDSVEPFDIMSLFKQPEGEQ